MCIPEVKKLLTIANNQSIKTPYIKHIRNTDFILDCSYHSLVLSNYQLKLAAQTVMSILFGKRKYNYKSYTYNLGENIIKI